MNGEKKVSEALKIETLIVILIVGILLTSSNSMPLVNAQPTPTSLTIKVPSVPQWGTCTIEATLKDENGNPLQNFDVDFVYMCDTCPHNHTLGTAKTDSNGVASLTYTFSARTRNVAAMFRGTTNYAPSSSEYVDIIIGDYTPYLVGYGIIAVAIIGVAGYIVFRRRNGRREAL